MKSYTDIEQSKKLAKILPSESADMYYYTVNGELCKTPNVIESEDDLHVDNNSIPCWSLAALLCVIPKLVTLRGNTENSHWYCECTGISEYNFEDSDNPVDACYGEILKLHKQYLLQLEKKEQSLSWDKDKVCDWLRDNIIKYAKLKTLHVYADNHGTIAQHFRGFNMNKLIEDLAEAMNPKITG